MRVLAIDTSSIVASVAIVEEEKLVAEFTINNKKTHSQTLLPMLEQMVKFADVSLESVDAIAISGGPGSFTGLRIGAATAKGLGLALNKPLIHVPTLKALAYNMVGTSEFICPIMDARRSQVYTGIYRFEKDELITEFEDSCIEIQGLFEKLHELGRSVVFLGDGISTYQSVIEENLKVPYTISCVHHREQRAAAVGALGLQYLKEGKTETASQHKPEYLRLSQAERERAEKQKNA